MTREEFLKEIGVHIVEKDEGGGFIVETPASDIDFPEESIA